MARVFLLVDLVTRCKQRADMVTKAHVSDPEWKGYISTAYAQLHSILDEADQRFFEKIFQFTFSDLADNGDNGGRIALPADYLTGLGVDRVTSTSREELAEMDLAQRNLFSNGPSGGGAALAYCLGGTNLILYPKPTQDNYELGYVPQPRDLSAESDSFGVDVVTPDGEDFVIWMVAHLALFKEESLEAAMGALGKAKEAEERLWKWANRRLTIPRRRIVVEEDDWPFNWEAD